MKIFLCNQRERGLTLVELLVIIAVLTFLYLMLLPRNTGTRARATRIQCVNNLKQIGLGYRVWPAGQASKFTFQESVTNGGTMEFTVGTNAFRHFLVMSNE